MRLFVFRCRWRRSPTPTGPEGVRPPAQIWSRIEPGAVTDACHCSAWLATRQNYGLSDRGNFAASIAYPLN